MHDLERLSEFNILIIHIIPSLDIDIAGEADGMSEIDSKVSTDTEFSRRIGEEDPLRSLEIDVITDIVMRSRLLHEQSIRVQDALINLRIGRNNSSDSSDSKSISTSTRVLRKFGKNMGVRTRSRTRLLGRIARSTRTRAALPRPGRDDKLGKRAGLSITEQFFEKQSFPLLLTQERWMHLLSLCIYLSVYKYLCSLAGLSRL
jgi:hypothetical protein